MNASKCLKEIPFKQQAFTNVYKSEPMGLERWLLVKSFCCSSKGPSTHVVRLITLGLAVQDVTHSSGLKRYPHKHEVDTLTHPHQHGQNAVLNQPDHCQ